VALAEAFDEAVEKQVDGTWRLRSCGSVTRGLGYGSHTARSLKATREQRGSERLEVRLACKPAVQGRETGGGVEQQRGGVGAAPASERQLGVEALQAGVLQVVERTDLGGRE